MHRLSVSPVAGCARAATFLARRASAASAAWIGRIWGSGRRVAFFRRLSSARLRLTMRNRRIQPQRGREQRLGGVEAPQLVQRDAGVVEDQRFARLLLEHLDGTDARSQEDFGGSVAGSPAGSVQSLLEQ